MGDCTDLQVIALLKICQIFMKNIKKDFIGRVKRTFLSQQKLLKLRII